MHARGEAQEKRYLIWRRIFEIIPGLASWSILLSVVVLAFVNPIKGMIFVICFYLFWLFTFRRVKNKKDLKSLWDSLKNKICRF